MRRATISTALVVAVAGLCAFAASFAGATFALDRGQSRLAIDTASALAADYSVDSDVVLVPPLSHDVIDAAREDDRRLREPIAPSGAEPTPTPAPTETPRTTGGATPTSEARGESPPASTPSPTDTSPARPPGGQATTVPALNTATPTAPAQPAATATPGVPATPAPKASATPAKTATATPTATPAASATPTKTPPPIPGATSAPTAAPSATPTTQPTATPTPPSTATPTPTATPTLPPGPPPATGARGQLTAAWYSIAPLLGANGGANDASINAALALLNAALAGSHWTDDDHVTSFEVFQETQQAAQQLAGVPASGGAQNQVAGAMRSLVTTLLGEAIAAGGNAGLIAQAQAKLALGDAARAGGDYAGAILQYRLAWSHADNAVP